MTIGWVADTLRSHELDWSLTSRAKNGRYSLVAYDVKCTVPFFFWGGGGVYASMQRKIMTVTVSSCYLKHIKTIYTYRNEMIIF